MRFLEIGFAARNLSRHGLRTLTTLAIMVVSVMVIQLVGGFYQAMFQGIERDLIRQEGHLWIKKKENGPFLGVAQAQRLKDSGVFSDWVYRRDLSGILGTEEKSGIFTGVVLDVEAEAVFRSFGEIEKKGYRIQTGPLLAQNLGIQPGAILSGFALDQGFSLSVDRIESTVSTDLDRFYQEIPLSGFSWEVDFSSLHLHVNTGVSLDDAKVILESLYPGQDYNWYDYKDSQSYFTAVKGIYSSNFQFILIVICLSVLFSIANSLVMSFLERKKEIGTIRSFGAPGAHLQRLIFWECLFLSLSAFGVGTVLASVLGMAVNQSGGWYLDPPPTVKDGIRLFYTWDLASISISGIIIAAVTLITGQAIGLSTHKEPIINQLSS